MEGTGRRANILTFLELYLGTTESVKKKYKIKCKLNKTKQNPEVEADAVS